MIYIIDNSEEQIILMYIDIETDDVIYIQRSVEDNVQKDIYIRETVVESMLISIENLCKMYKQKADMSKHDIAKCIERIDSMIRYSSEEMLNPEELTNLFLKVSKFFIHLKNHSSPTEKIKVKTDVLIKYFEQWQKQA